MQCVYIPICENLNQALVTKENVHFANFPIGMPWKEESR